MIASPSLLESEMPVVSRIGFCKALLPRHAVVGLTRRLG
jgi:hypothetical protein